MKTLKTKIRLITVIINNFRLNINNLSEPFS
jgi:hypothetical protein